MIRAALLAGLIALTMSACGYRFAGQVVREQPVAVQVRSAAVEPGLALVARRGLATAATRHELDLEDLSDDTLDARWQLDLVVVSAEARPVGAVYTESGSSDRATTATTTWRVEAVLEATLVELGTARTVTTQVSGEALFEDARLGLWTDDARQRATERALGVACARLGDWLVLQLAGATDGAGR